ncbi:MAG: dihydroorotase [Actinobacteria bacterium]|nr:dihydroorotase [Actinomycetota bacterium]
MALLLKGARVIDPAVGLDGIIDIKIGDGRIADVGKDLDAGDCEVRDLAGMILIPGLIDVHVHLREPGQEYKETIESGTRAAAKGGFVGVCPMPNTKPVCDSGPRLRYLVETAEKCGYARLYPVGSLSTGLAGTQLSEMGDMVAQGAIAFSDDGRGVQNDGMMRRAMDYAKMFDCVVMSHCQSEDLVGNGVVNEGVASTRLGLAGWPAEGEEIQIARDIALCRLTGCRLHIQHVTTAGGVKIIRAAKLEGLPVSCEVTPHHLFLDEDSIDTGYNTNLKMNPPLRTKDDCAALQDALLDGTIDCIASDHAPHAAHEKALEFELAPFGTIGLETTLPLVLTNMVRSGRMSYARLVDVLSHNPRRILKLEPVTIERGSSADLTVIDPEAHFVVSVDGFESKSANSAFIGETLVGMAYDTYVAGVATLCSGKVV